MLHEPHTACREGGWVFFRPDAVLALLKDWAAVLHDEFEGGVEVGELDVESACIDKKEI